MSNTNPSDHSEDSKASAKFLLAPVIIAVIILAALIVVQEMRTSSATQETVQQEKQASEQKLDPSAQRGDLDQGSQTIAEGE